MKRSTLQALFMAAGAAALTSCGGSGTTDESGSLTPFTVNPTTLTVTGPPLDPSAPTGTVASCPGATTLDRVEVSGGTAPYRITALTNSVLVVDKATIESKNGTFGITFLGGCYENATIDVADHLDRHLTVTVTGKRAQ
jgi:hypothetical protein